MSSSRPPDEPGRPLAVFDIDGVLADVRHRLRFLERRPKDWDAFFAAAVHDPLLEPGAQLAAEARLDCEIIYVTGRPERCRQDTVSWLGAKALPAGSLHMRPLRDRRPAARPTPLILRRVAQGRTVALVVDDDLVVCDAYEAAGWQVLRATWADRSAVLERAQEIDGRS